MSDQNAQEPTMEEILASIRRIISEDDAPADGAASEPEAAAAPPPAPAPAPEPAPPPPMLAEEPEDDVLDLTDPISPVAETHGDLDIYTPGAPPPPAFEAAPEPPPAPFVAPISAPAPSSNAGLVSEPAAKATASAFSNLAAHIAMPAAGRTLEDVTRELLKPLLAAWLDENLPRIVEAKVEEEVQRIARGR